MLYLRADLHARQQATPTPYFLGRENGAYNNG
jgi:hypothetical protein